MKSTFGILCPNWRSQGLPHWSKRLKTADEKVITVSADRDLFKQLAIAAKSWDLNLWEVLSYELSSVPFSLAHPFNSLRKTNKNVWLFEQEKCIDVQSKLPGALKVSAAHIFYAMSLMQMIKPTGASTFGEVATRYCNMVTIPLWKNGCQQVDIVFDTYLSLSIKAGEWKKKGASAGIEVKIHGPSTELPRHWAKYISNRNNKVNLCVFLVETVCHYGRHKLINLYKTNNLSLVVASKMLRVKWLLLFFVCCVVHWFIICSFCINEKLWNYLSLEFKLLQYAY